MIEICFFRKFFPLIANRVILIIRLNRILNRMINRNYVPQTKQNVVNSQPATSNPTTTPNVEQNNVTQNIAEVPVNQGYQGFWLIRNEKCS